MTAAESFEPLQNVRKDFRVEWYRCPIQHAKLREVMRPNDMQGWIQAGGHLSIAVVTGIATLCCFHYEMWMVFGLSLIHI